MESSNKKELDKMPSVFDTDEKRSARAEYMRIYREKNKEALKQKATLYMSKNSNREEINQRRRQKRAENPDKYKEQRKASYEKHIGKRKSEMHEYRKNNKEKIKARTKDWRESNKEWMRVYTREKRKEPLHRLRHRISSKIRVCFLSIGSKKVSSTIDILGCTISEFRSFIESKFEPWMTWDNYGKYNGTRNFGWDLDHIIPLSLADNAVELEALNYHTNFQPLCSVINRDIKKDKLEFTL